jgi:DNA-binding response OmpR family regulator
MSGGRKILIVDDDVPLRHALAEQLELHEEFSPVESGTAAEALDLVKGQYFDAVILDVGLPDMDGRELCRLMRRTGVRAPIVMLTGADSDADAILGLDSGANDYVTKPFRLNMLLARLRAQLRQHELSEDAVFTIGPYTFRPSAKLLVDEGGRKKVRLTE